MAFHARAALLIFAAAVCGTSAGFMTAGHAATSGDPVDSAAPSGPMSVVIGVEPEQLTCLAGGIVDGEPVGAAELLDRLRDGQSYRLFDLKGEQGETISIGLPRNEGGEGECADLWRQDLSLDPGAERAFRAAISLPESVKKPLPDTLELMDAPLPEHLALLREFLARRDVPNPEPEVKQAIRTDLDSDGKPDYILNVVRISEDAARQGDHSIVLVVRGEGAASRTFIVQEEISVEDSEYPSTLWINTIVAVVDIDGDGNAEIITEGGYLYGGGWEVIRWDRNGFDHVLFCGCDG